MDLRSALKTKHAKAASEPFMDARNVLLERINAICAPSRCGTLAKLVFGAGSSQFLFGKNKTGKAIWCARYERVAEFVLLRRRMIIGQNGLDRQNRSMTQRAQTGVWPSTVVGGLVRGNRMRLATQHDEILGIMIITM